MNNEPAVKLREQGKEYQTPLIFFPFLILAVASFLITKKITLMGFTDLSVHIQLANQFLAGEAQITYPGWHLIYGLLHAIGLSEVNAGAAATSFYSVLAILSVYVVISSLRPAMTALEKSGILIFFSFFGPLRFQALDGHYLIGQSSFNIWHNPTNTAVKFMAILLFFAFVSRLQMEKTAKIQVFGKQFSRQWLDGFIAVGLVISVLLKPSFFQVFCPSVFLMCLIELWNDRKNFKNRFLDCVHLGLLFLPALLLVLYQSTTVFGGESGVEIAFLNVWKAYSSNVLLSILTTAIFPLFIGAFCTDGFEKNKLFWYAFLFYVVSVAEAAFLAETGAHCSDGNFFWGISLAVGIVFLAALLTFTRYLHDHWNEQKILIRLKAGVGYLILTMHFCFGLWYYFQILSGSSGQFF